MAATDVSVLHVDTERGWRGGQQQAIYLFEHMLSRGIDAHFVCRRSSRLETYLRGKGLPHHTEPLSGEIDLLSGRRIARFAEANGYRVLYLHSAHAISIGVAARTMNPALRTIGVRRVDFPLGGSPFSRWKYASTRLDRIVAISENIRSVLLRDGIDPERIAVIRSGIDPHRFDDDEPLSRAELHIPSEAVVVGTVAGMVAHKDYPNLLRAAARVIRTDDSVRFIAAGAGPDEPRIRTLARELGLGERFVFLGERGDVGSVLKAMDVFVLASKLEGLGTSVLDAMSVGLPVVGTTAGGIPEMVADGETGLLAPPEDPGRLAAAVLTLSRDRALRERLGRGAIERVKDFDYRVMGERSLELCRSLL